LNNMTTNLPAKMATAMVVPAAAAAEMVVVGSKRRVWMGRRLQSLQQNDAANPQPNGQQQPVVVPAAAAADHPAAMLDISEATKVATKTNVGPWQQGNNKGGMMTGAMLGCLPSSSTGRTMTPPQATTRATRPPWTMMVTTWTMMARCCPRCLCGGSSGGNIGQLGGNKDGDEDNPRCIAPAAAMVKNFE
jgi:hypothetical protein